MLISDDYRALQRVMHLKRGYGDSGGKWWLTVAGVASVHEAINVLDYGCGTRAMTEALRANVPWLEVNDYDPGVLGLDAVPVPKADVVSCIDVLEHVEPDCLDDVINHLCVLTRKALFTVISTRLAGKIMPDGRNAHLIVESSRWWHARFGPMFLLLHNWTHTAEEWCAIWEPRRST